MKADLHMHTTFSDGRKTYSELIEGLKQADVDVFSITDHDTIQAVEDIQKLAEKNGLTYIPGVELSTVEGQKSIHVLGYFTDTSYQKESLHDYFNFIRKAREERAKKMIENFKIYHDIHITYEEVIEHSNGIIARPHLAKAITAKYPKWTHDLVFEKIIGESCPSYVPTSEMDVASGIDFLRAHHCIVVLAHPTLIPNDIRDKVMSNDFDGIEAVYYRNKPGEEKTFRSFAKKRGMIITGGSDYHGIEGDTKHGQIGDVVLTGRDLKKTLKKLKR